MDDLRGGSKQIAFTNISRGYDFAGKGLVFNNLDAVFFIRREILQNYLKYSDLSPFSKSDIYIVGRTSDLKSQDLHIILITLKDCHAKSLKPFFVFEIFSL